MEILNKIFGLFSNKSGRKAGKISLGDANEISTVSSLKNNYGITFEPAIKLLDNMKSTARSRFFAAKRLSAKDRILTMLTALTSGYLIVLTVVPYILHIDEPRTDIINFIVVAFAVVILVSSLFQYSSSDVVNAEQHHRSGLEINEIVRELVAYGDAVDKAIYDAYSLRYNSILQKYSVNHDDLDYMAVQLDRPQDYPWNGYWTRLGMRVSRLVGVGLPSIFLWLVSIGFVGVILFYAIPAQGSAH